MNKKAQSYIIRYARQAWFYYDENRKLAYLSAKNGKLYKCALCGYSFSKSSCECDHIVPIGKFTNWSDYMTKLFCPLSNLRILCKPCHKARKTK